MSASWFLELTYLIWTSGSTLILSNNHSHVSLSTVWVLDTCLIVGLCPSIIILITASLSSKKCTTEIHCEKKVCSWAHNPHYHQTENDYSYKYEINSKTIDPHQITNITFFLNSKTIHPQTNYRRYRYCRFLSSVGSWSVDRGAHIQVFTFSSQDHGRLSNMRISEHSR